MSATPKIKIHQAAQLIRRKDNTFLSGFSELDKLTGGIPRSAIIEICGQNSSGRTALLFSILGRSLADGNVCAYIDSTNSFDPVSVSEQSIGMERLLWVKSGGDPDKTFAAADTVLQAGGFSVIALDIADLSIEKLNRIPLSYWFRFQRTIEKKSSTLVVISKFPVTKTCASLVICCGNSLPIWAGEAFPILSRIKSELIINRPAPRRRSLSFFPKSYLIHGGR